MAEVVQKIKNYIGSLSKVANKAKFFNNELKRAGHVSRAEVITILVNYLLKMEKILE